MTTQRMTALLLGLALAGGCARGENASDASADSTARNLTLAPAESSAAMRDMPATPPATAPVTRPATPRPTQPAAPATLTLAAGTHFDMAAADTIPSRSAKPGDPFTARVVEDVRNAAGQVVIPAGSQVSGTISDVKAAPNPNTPGTLTLAGSSVTIGGTNYPLPTP